MDNIIKKRYIYKPILEDLKSKMVFVGGPRQVGKTTLALSFLKTLGEDNPAYINWDTPDVKSDLIKGILPADENLIILDEIHKYKNWRNLVKGFYDKYKNKRSFLITGSARLDYYRRGGDSLQGRYHYYRLHPFTLSELNVTPSKTDLEMLMKFGGFPEPLFKAEDKFWKRWSRERFSRIIQEDVITLEHVKELSQLSLLASVLPEKVGSILSINSLREDFNVAFNTIERWINIMENLYHCFRILPYGYSKLRTAKKEKKLYLWDWSQCFYDKGKCFENLVASHLLKYCHYYEDTEGDTMNLCFLRDSEAREIDFIVLKNSKPIFAVECKSGEKDISKNIKYFSKRIKDIPIFYQVHMGSKDFENIDFKTRVLPFTKFCKVVGLF